MLSSGANVIIWDEMLLSGMICSHLELIISSGMKMLLSGMKCYPLELMSSSGTKCYHLRRNVIICYEMLLSGANVIIWD